MSVESPKIVEDEPDWESDLEFEETGGFDCIAWAAILISVLGILGIAHLEGKL